MSSRKPQRVASCSPAAIGSSTASASCRVGLVLVGLEGLLEPADPDLLVRPRHARWRRCVGDVAEPGVDHDREPVARGSDRGLGQGDVVVGILADRAPAELGRREAGRTERRHGGRHLVRRVRHEPRGVGPDPIAHGRPEQPETGMPSALPFRSHNAMSTPLMAWIAIPRRPT